MESFLFLFRISLGSLDMRFHLILAHTASTILFFFKLSIKSMSRHIFIRIFVLPSVRVDDLDLYAHHVPLLGVCSIIRGIKHDFHSQGPEVSGESQG